MSHALTIFGCLALAAFTGLCVEGVAVLESVNSTVAGLPALVDARAASIQSDAGKKIDAAISAVNDRLNQALLITDKRTGQALKLVDSRTAAIIDPKTGILAIAGKSESDMNDRMADTNKILAATAKPIAESAQQVNDTLPLFLDCEYNADCIFNRYVGVAKSVERTSQVISSEMPKMTDHVDKIAAASVVTADSVAATSVEVKKAAQNFNKPQTKMQALRSWLITIARIYGAI